MRRARFMLLPCLLSLAAASHAQVFIERPMFKGMPVDGSEPGISLPLPGATPEEYHAALLWNLRAGLNVAALQCQSMEFLDAVHNYNAMLNNHGDELRPAYETLSGYFKRTIPGKAAMKAFDDYNTKTYNGFSTLYAQRGFCDTAASIGRDVLFAPRGGLAGIARARMREFRNSLVPSRDRFFATQTFHQSYARLPQFPADCFDRKGAIKKSCLRDRNG